MPWCACAYTGHPLGAKDWLRCASLARPFEWGQKRGHAYHGCLCFRLTGKLLNVAGLQCSVDWFVWLHRAQPSLPVWHWANSIVKLNEGLYEDQQVGNVKKSRSAFLQPPLEGLLAVQWPREGALAARMQLQAQAQADREAAAAAAARQQEEGAQQRTRPPSARLAQRPPAPKAEEDAEPVEEAIKEEPAFIVQPAQPPTAVK